MKLYISFLFLVLAFACNTKKKTVSIEEAPMEITDSTSRFIVSFISYGAGTDYQAKKQFKNFLETYQLNNNISITYSTSPWGREGEIDYCFQLSELSLEKQEAFILQLKETLKESTLVRYKENSSCIAK